MWYVVTFGIGAFIGGLVIYLMQVRKVSDVQNEVIKVIVERSIERYKQNKKTEEIIKEIDELLR